MKRGAWIFSAGFDGMDGKPTNSDGVRDRRHIAGLSGRTVFGEARLHCTSNGQERKSGYIEDINTATALAK